MSKESKPETATPEPAAEPPRATVELNLEELKGIAGGVAQVGLNVVGSFKPATPHIPGEP